MKPGAESGFFGERAASDSFCVRKRAASFEKCGFISVRSFKTKQPRGHKNKAALSTKKPRSAPIFIVRVQQSRSDRAEIKAHLSKAATALLNACNEAWCGERLFW